MIICTSGVCSDMWSLAPVLLTYTTEEMTVRFPDPIHSVDPVEFEINQLINHLISYLNQRQVTLLTTNRPNGSRYDIELHYH